MTQARRTSITSPYASVWKDTTPSIPELRLADPHYRIASRMNLGLPAFVHLPDNATAVAKMEHVLVILIITYHVLHISVEKSP